MYGLFIMISIAILMNSETLLAMIGQDREISRSVSVSIDESLDTGGRAICTMTSCSERPSCDICIVRERHKRLYGHVARLPAENSAHRIRFLRDLKGRMRFCSLRRGDLSVGSERGRTGVCVDNGQTEAAGVLSQCGRVDALLRRMPLYLT